jgi:hypothetical protein
MREPAIIAEDNSSVEGQRDILLFSLKTHHWKSGKQILLDVYVKRPIIFTPTNDQNYE